MSQTANEPRVFKGNYAALMEQFAELMDRLWQEHRTSPTIAGSEKFYAWGNIDYVVVMSEHRFNDLVEIKCPYGNLDIKKDADGKIDCSLNIDERESAKKSVEAQKNANPVKILHNTVAALKHYYYAGMR